jgi:hypothetical protein
MNTHEMGPEQIPTKESVMEVIKGFEENAVIVRELEDEKGLYLLEANIKGEKPGEYTQYAFIREGIFKEGQSLETCIHVVFYEDDVACGGHNVAVFAPTAGVWEVQCK